MALDVMGNGLAEDFLFSSAKPYALSWSSTVYRRPDIRSNWEPIVLAVCPAALISAIRRS